MGMRPAVLNGLTPEQKIFKQDLERVKFGNGLKMVGGNKWVGDAAPQFNFMSLAPIPEPDKKYDAMLISSTDHNKLKLKNFDYINNLQRWSNCTITVLEKEYPSQRAKSDSMAQRRISIMPKRRLSITW